MPFSSLSKGKSVQFTIKASGKFEDATGAEREGREYTGHTFVDRDEPIPDHIIESVFSLDECINMNPSDEAMEKAFRGTVSKKSEPETQPSESMAKEPEPKIEPFECPAGHTAGTDNDKFDDCFKCQRWDDCSDLKDQYQREKGEDIQKASERPKETPKEEPEQQSEPAPTKGLTRRRRLSR